MSNRSKVTIIIEIEELDLSQIDSNAGHAFTLRAQLMRDGHKVAANQIGCYASTIHKLIATWLAAHKHHLIP